jgi:hypothetical protein
MINKLKLECGNVFTSKLEGMFQDLELSSDLMTYYNDYLKSSSSSSSSSSCQVDLSAKVLTMAYWPM